MSSKLSAEFLSFQQLALNADMYAEMTCVAREPFRCDRLIVQARGCLLVEMRLGTRRFDLDIRTGGLYGVELPHERIFALTGSRMLQAGGPGAVLKFYNPTLAVVFCKAQFHGCSERGLSP